MNKYKALRKGSSKHEEEIFMRLHGIIKVSILLFADCALIRLVLNKEAAVAVTAGILLYAWLGEYIALLKDGAISLNQLSPHEKSRLLRIQACLSEDVSRVSGISIANIKLHVRPSGSINAYAYGFRHISMTMAMLNSCDDTTLCAVLGHEISHTLHMDAVFHRIIFANIAATLVGLIAVSLISTSFMWILFILLCAFGICGGLFSVFAFYGIRKLTGGIFMALQHGLLFLYQIAMGMASRGCEFRADLYSCELGYGPQLRYFLTRFAEGQETRRHTLNDILYASHPAACKRILRIDQFHANILNRTCR